MKLDSGSSEIKDLVSKKILFYLENIEAQFNNYNFSEAETNKEIIEKIS